MVCMEEKPLGSPAVVILTRVVEDADTFALATKLLHVYTH